jgi:hypothetical protein
VLFIRCSNREQNLIISKNDSNIDLTKLDSVRENLNGFWVSENRIGSGEILWLDFHKEKNSTTWEIIPFNEEIQQTKLLPIKSCPAFVKLTKQNETTVMKFVSLGGSDTTQIQYLTKNKFKIRNNVYLRHKGYSFLKSWSVH